MCALYKSLVQGGSNMTGTNCDLFTHNQSRSYLNHLVSDQIRRIEMGEACVAYGREEMHSEFWQGNLRKRFHVEDIGID